MAELNYAKKRLEPIILKFGIDVANDKVFESIITLFNGQTDYQLWALKVIYSKWAVLDTIIQIKEWADANPTDIQHLSKKNIILYNKGMVNIVTLLTEIRNIKAVHLVKNAINTFNTEQKRILKANVLDRIGENYFNALENPHFARFHNLVKDFNLLPEHRKNKFVVLMSAVSNYNTILEQMQIALEETYAWDREDLLSYIARTKLDTEVVFDTNNVVVLRIGDFDTSRKLCGGGRTSWCLTREENYFKNYTSNQENSQQFFLFDFNLPEKHELAHVGFSVHPKRGIVNAHTTRNNNIMGQYTIGDTEWDINKVLKHHNISKAVYIRLKQLKNFKWDKVEFMTKLKEIAPTAKVMELQDGRIVITINNDSLFSFILGHTLISKQHVLKSDVTCFAVIDFTKDVNDDLSIVLPVFSKDIYGGLSANTLYDAYGGKMGGLDVLNTLNLSSSIFVDNTNIEPNILLHKYIDEKNYKDAIKLLKENKNVDPNTMFLSNLPIVKSFTSANKELFDALVNHEKFDVSLTDGFGEPFAQFLVLNIQSKEDNKGEQEKIKTYTSMCMTFLENPKYDCNVGDINDDTVLHLACETPLTLPIVEYLVSRKDVDINLTNDWGYTPLDVAIESLNTEAIKLLLQREDLQINKDTKKLATNLGVDLEKLMAENQGEKKEEVKKTHIDITPNADDFEDIFARVLRD